MTLLETLERRRFASLGQGESCPAPVHEPEMTLEEKRRLCPWLYPVEDAWVDELGVF